MDNKTIEKFFNSTVKPSDFKFKWAIYRYKRVDCDKLCDAVEKADWYLTYKRILNGVLPIDSEEAKRCRTKYLELEAEFTSKHYTYELQRRCSAIDSIVKKLAEIKKTSEKNYTAIAKSSNYTVMFAKNREEHRRSHKFSSLSSMQKWVDKNSIGIDVYKLWESAKSAQ